MCQGSSAWESTRLKTGLSRVQISPLALFMFEYLFFIIFINKDTSCFSTLMAEKKTKKKTTKKTSKAKTAKSKAKSKAKTKNKKEQEDFGDGIAIIDDDLSIDQEKINEERRAYLEEARSQEASD